MVAVLPAAVLMLAEAAQPTTPAPQAAAPVSQSADAPAPSRDACPQPDAASTTIVICTQRPQGYRLNPDILEAKREMKNSSRPVRPNGVPRPDCATVGPAPCVSAGINLVAAALTAAEMADRLAKGQEVGSMFVTDPHPTEYQLYLEAKREREAKEAAKKAKAIAKAANAKGDAAVPQPEPAAEP